MTRSPRPLVSHPSPRPSAVAVMLSSVTWPGCQMTSRHTRHSTAKSTYLWADHQAANGITVPVVLTTDGLTRSGMTTTYHLRTSGGALSVVVIAERRYGPCWLSDDNNARRRLRSFSTSALVTPRTTRATIGNRAFPSAAASVWNSLPESVRGSPTLPVFRNRLKTELFARSFS